MSIDIADALAKFKSGKLSEEEMTSLLSANSNGRLSCKVSQKGAISVYGLQRMPVTLYVEQWERLLDFANSIREFAKANSKQLARKKKAA